MNFDHTHHLNSRLPVSVALVVAYLFSLPHFLAGLVAAVALVAGDHQVLTTETTPGTQIILHHAPSQTPATATPHHHTLLTRSLVCWSLDAPNPGEPDHVFLFQKSHLALLATDDPKERTGAQAELFPVSYAPSLLVFHRTALDLIPPRGCFAASRWLEEKNPELLSIPRSAHQSTVLII